MTQILLSGLLHEPSRYGEFLRFLARAGCVGPASTPADGIGSMASRTPPIMAMIPVRAGIELTDQA